MEPGVGTRRIAWFLVAAAVVTGIGLAIVHRQAVHKVDAASAAVTRSGRSLFLGSSPLSFSERSFLCLVAS
jgi:hypothetical protein